MPHIIIKMYPGRTEEQKRNLVDRITRAVIDTINAPEASISVGVEEILPELWEEEVKGPDILGKKDTLYKKPGYMIPED